MAKKNIKTQFLPILSFKIMMVVFKRNAKFGIFHEKIAYFMAKKGSKFRICLYGRNLALLELSWS